MFEVWHSSRLSMNLREMQVISEGGSLRGNPLKPDPTQPLEAKDSLPGSLIPPKAIYV